MRIEFSYWPANTEVKLIEDIDEWVRVVDSFYTSAKQVVVAGLPFDREDRPFDARSTFQLAEELLPKPVIAGEWGHLHPYWHEREQRRKHGG